MTTQNTTFAQLSSLDQVALYLPHVIYSSRLSPDVLSSAILVLSAVALLTAGSYSTVCQPRTAKDPCDDKKSPLWDVTDRDDCPLYFTSADQAAECNSDVIGAKSVILLVAGAAGALYALDYVLRMYGISALRSINYYLVAMVIPCGTVTFQWGLGVVSREVGHRLGLKHNSGYFFPRFQFSVSAEDRLPVGWIEPFDERKLGLDPRTVEHYKQWMLRHNGVKVLRPSRVDSRHQQIALVTDFRFPLAFFAAVSLSAVYYHHHPQLSGNYAVPQVNWLVNNAVASVFALCGCRQIRAPTFSVAVLLLGALFVYDVYFVFATPMMEAVAMGVELPLKLVFPNAPATVFSAESVWNQPYHRLLSPRSLLGLGDIVVPCVFSSLCLRFDYSQFYAKNAPLSFHRLRSIGVPVYFCTAVACYTLALVVTVTASHVWGRGQPALLYIVPAMFAGVGAVAAFRREIQDVSAYSEIMVAYQKPDTCAGEPVAEGSDTATAVYVQAETVYVFDDDETDDTYVIEEDTDEDEEPFEDDPYDDEDLSDEIDLLLLDQRHDAERN